MAAVPPEQELPRTDPLNLLFLFNSAYLPAFKVLLFSMRDLLARERPNIVIITDDAGLADDAFVRAVAGRVVLIGDAEIARLQQIPRESVDAKLQLQHIAKYTFLKFFMFQELGLSSFLFMDVDMIAMHPAPDLRSLLGHADFAAAPVVGPGKYKGAKAPDGKRGPKPEPVARTVTLAERRFKRADLFNSGLCAVGPRMIGEDTIRGLVSVANEGGHSGDQRVLHAYLNRMPEISFRSLPFWWNVTEVACRALGAEGMAALRDRIQIVHFNRTKPWHPDAAGDWFFALWHEQQRRSAGWCAEVEAGLLALS